MRRLRHPPGLGIHPTQQPLIRLSCLERSVSFDHGTDEPIDTGANFEVPEPGNDANQTRLATDKSPYPNHLIGGDAVDPGLGLQEHGIDKRELARRGLVEWVKFAYR